jgi:hypothetical protein
MRFMLIVTAVAVAMLFDLRASRAYQGPWCAVQNIGHAVVYNCSMRTLEMCTQEVIATADFAIRTRITAGPKPLRSGPSENATTVDLN